MSYTPEQEQNLLALLQAEKGKAAETALDLRPVEDAAPLDLRPAETSSRGTAMSDLPLLQKLLLPSTLPREFVQQRTQRGIQMAQDVAGTTPVGQAVEMAFSPPLSPMGAIARTIMQPERLASVMGQAADPLSYVGVKAGKESLKIPDFLRGNTKAIGRAEDALEQAAHNTVKSLRPSGKLHAQVMGTISRESAKAWAPMQQVANAIPGEIPVAELRAAASAKYAAEPARAQALEVLFKQLEESGQAFAPLDLVDLSSDMGRAMTKSGLKGTAARTFSDLVYSDARSLIADLLEMKAPLEMKGFVGQAKQQWAAYAADRDALFKTFHLGSPQNAPTQAGVKALKRAALGQASPYEQELLGRVVEKSGLDLPASIRPYAEALLKAKAGGRFGKKVGKGAAYAIGAGGAAQVIKTIFGKD